MTGKINSCPICRSSLRLDTLVAPELDVYAGKLYRYGHCSACDVLVLQNPPSDKNAADIDYSESGYYNNKKVKFSSLVALVSKLYTAHRVRTAKKFIADNTFSGKKVLDIGCGKGRFLEQIKYVGGDIRGVEPTRRSFESARESLGNVIEHSIMSNGLFEIESFDMVTLWHVFEHLPDPISMLNACHEVLKPDGILIVAVPNFSGAFAKSATWFNLDPPRHLIHFNEKSLPRLLKDNGFSVVGVNYYYPELAYLGTLQSMLNQLPITPNFLFNLLKRNLIGLPSSKLIYGKDIVITCVAGFMLSPFVILAVHLLSMMHRSDCVTVIAKKT